MDQMIVVAAAPVRGLVRPTRSARPLAPPTSGRHPRSTLLARTGKMGSWASGAGDVWQIFI